MGLVRKVGSTLSFTFVSTDSPSDRRCEVPARRIIRAKDLGQSMLFILAVALSTSLAGMLTVLALNTPFSSSCVHEYFKRPYFMKLTPSLVAAKVADIDFYICHETRAASHIWLYVIDATVYLS